MAAGGKNLNASQFYVTTGVELDSLDDRNTVFGEVRYPVLSIFLSGTHGRGCIASYGNGLHKAVGQIHG